MSKIKGWMSKLGIGDKVKNAKGKVEKPKGGPYASVKRSLDLERGNVLARKHFPPHT